MRRSKFIKSLTIWGSLIRTLLVAMLFIFQSCTTIHYQSSNKIPVYLNHIKKHEASFRVQGREEFFLWGFVPSARNVNIDKLGQQEGFKELSKLNIYEYSTGSDILLSILTLGLYLPRRYILTAWGER